MKFKIRFADQIVGFFVIVALLSLAFVIVMLGRSQRWFSKDVSFKTSLSSAAGLNNNMAIQYKGFTIGSVKKFYLAENDEVEVIFVIHEEYKDWARQGSMVEMIISPVGLGNQFQFHAGTGEILADGSFVPVVGSAQARELVRQGLATEPRQDDSISALMNRVNSILAQVDEALESGTDATDIGRIIGSLQRIMAGAEGIPVSVEQLLAGIQADLGPILSNINDLTTELTNPDGLIYSVLDTDKDVYTNLVKILSSLSGTIEGLDRTISFIPGQLPQLAGLIMDLRVTMKSVEDVLVALTNNPLLRKGVPERQETQSDGTSPRDIRF